VTARDLSKLPSELTPSLSVKGIVLNVTPATSTAAAVEVVSKKTGGRGFDVLVNNSIAGYTSLELDVDI
jgi:hypothetical protein